MILVDTVRAYTAGLIDGDGCILLTERKRPPTRRCKTPSFVLSVSIVMTDKAGIELVNENFGGRVNVYKREESRKPFYRFNLSCSKEVKPLLEAILPYVRVKKPQVELALAYFDLPSFRGGPRGTVPDWIVGARRIFVQKMHELNNSHKPYPKGGG